MATSKFRINPKDFNELRNTLARVEANRSDLETRVAALEASINAIADVNTSGAVTNKVLKLNASGIWVPGTAGDTSEF